MCSLWMSVLHSFLSSLCLEEPNIVSCPHTKKNKSKENKQQAAAAFLPPSTSPISIPSPPLPLSLQSANPSSKRLLLSPPPSLVGGSLGRGLFAVCKFVP
ncbi:hypothetical protein MLD38_035347 [Melastoma candidum]|uniref:Uncharacterized protein n=1 Tax=Melastoma candidum TaxID=119954 RepID=A0ACB9LH04_9MYRT|nr:hypothetical protein MLD38_035347 [Melastoma candidum]